MLPPLYPLQNIHAFGRASYKTCPDLPSYRPACLRDTNSVPWHSLLTPVTSYVGVFLLKGPPVIDGPDFAKTIKAFMDSLASAL